MKKIRVLLGVCLLIVQLSYAQKEITETNSQKRVVSSFHGIEASAGVQVFITKGNKEELAVSVDDLEYLNQVKTTVSNGILRITRQVDWKFWNTWKNWKIRVYVSYVDLDDMEANSGGSITGTDINLKSLNAETNSGGLIKLTGKTSMLNVEANSGGNFNGDEFLAENCKAEASSGGYIKIAVTKEISAEASSGGAIRYRGDGLIRNISTSSGGSIKKQ